jgi:hypothetical protein
MPKTPWFLAVLIAKVSGSNRRSKCQNSRPDLEQVPSVEWLLSHRDQRKALTSGHYPLASLYRMYEYIVLDYNIGLRTEIEWFWTHSTWAVKDIPVPNDPDPQRAAILATIPSFMVMAYNRLIEVGLHRDAPTVITQEIEAEMAARPKIMEEVPEWTASIPALTETLIIPPRDGGKVEEQCQSPEFRKMNIICNGPDVFFV